MCKITCCHRSDHVISTMTTWIMYSGSCVGVSFHGAGVDLRLCHLSTLLWTLQVSLQDHQFTCNLHTFSTHWGDSSEQIQHFSLELMTDTITVFPFYMTYSVCICKPFNMWYIYRNNDCFLKFVFITFKWTITSAFLSRLLFVGLKSLYMNVMSWHFTHISHSFSVNTLQN